MYQYCCLMIRRRKTHCNPLSRFRVYTVFRYLRLRSGTYDNCMFPEPYINSWLPCKFSELERNLPTFGLWFICQSRAHFHEQFLAVFLGWLSKDGHKIVNKTSIPYLMLTLTCPGLLLYHDHIYFRSICEYWLNGSNTTICKVIFLKSSDTLDTP